MLMTTAQITPTDLALALLRLPSLGGLTEAQVRGVTCVWDASENPLTDETAVDLGPRRMKRLIGHSNWYPRSCREHVSEHALLALLRHCMKGCESCGSSGTEEATGTCDLGRALIRLVLHRGRR